MTYCDYNMSIATKTTDTETVQLPTQALKFDKEKPPVSLIPSAALFEEAKVLAYGAKKYGRDNWAKGMEWSRLLDATLRHLLAYKEGEDLDPETGISHIAHARCSLGFLLHYIEKGLGKDDRYKG